MTVSVVIPSYNGGRHIEKAILSVLRQQRVPDEILICDDNSTDDTLEICRRYKDLLSIHTNPAGPSGFVRGWNNAIEKASGDYICILHQDDVLAPEFIRVAMTALGSNPDVLHLFCTCKYIDEKGDTLQLSYPTDTPGPPERRFTGAGYVKAYQGLGHPHIHRCPGVITHRSIFGQCRYQPAAGHIADDDFFYRVGMFTDVIGILLPMASFRLHSSSVTGSMQDAALAGQLMDDYLYQCRQWKDHPFMDQAAYNYFVKNARKYIRRFIGYGIRRRKIGMIIKGVKSWRMLIGLQIASL
jgi:glycosyltransferase involved in cell wall biosynthesis